MREVRTVCDGRLRVSRMCLFVFCAKGECQFLFQVEKGKGEDAR